jgi:molecular chaperone IbpA
MKTLELNPFYRSTVGFDRLFELLDNSVRSDWPPYDIEKLNDDEYRISMAVAGFKQSEIEITQQGSDLLVVGQKNVQEDGGEVLHRGIAARSFKQVFNLADHIKVASASIDNGLLQIDLFHEVPEQLKPRKIEIEQARTVTKSQREQRHIGETSGSKIHAA